MRFTDVLLDIVKSTLSLGQTIWSPVYGKVTYRGIVSDNIVCVNSNNDPVFFKKDGKLYKDGLCMIYPGQYKQDWVAFARESGMTCPLYEEFFQFLASRDLLEKERKAHCETLNDYCWNNFSKPEYWLTGLDITSMANEDEWHDYVLRKLAA